MTIDTESRFGAEMPLAISGYGAFDALHLACAEQGFVDAFLTTDDRLIRQVGRGLGKPTMRVLNPVNWVQEVGR